MKYILFTLVFAIVNHCTVAYNSNNSLVSTYDTLTVFDETNTQVGQWKMQSFPYIDGVSDDLPCFS